MDCNHWFDPKNPKALALKKKIEDKGEFYTYEVYMNYSCILLLADALERAGSADRAKIIAAMESSTFAGHVMPYGPTKFVNGQNQGAAPVNTQVHRQGHPGDLPRGNSPRRRRCSRCRRPDVRRGRRRRRPGPPCCHQSSSFRRCSTG